MRIAALRAPSRRWVGLGQRLLAALLMGPAVVVIAWRGAGFFVALVAAIAVAGVLEFSRMLVAKGLQPHRTLGVASAVLLPVLACVRAGAYLEVGLAVAVLAILTAELFRTSERALENIATSVLQVIYVAWLASHLVRLRELPHLTGLADVRGFHFVVFVLLVTWMADTGAYVVGSVAGRHRLAPRISPAKSVEGALGGLLFAIVAGTASAATYLQGVLSPLVGAGLGALAAVFGLFGDLAESRLKRDAHVKDTSAAIPGHGGALDRFDSVLFTAPLLYFVLRFVVL